MTDTLTIDTDSKKATFFMKLRIDGVRCASYINNKEFLKSQLMSIKLESEFVYL